MSGLLRQLWPSAQVHLFGSGANELDIGGNNDLDVCLELNELGDTKEERGESGAGWCLLKVMLPRLRMALGSARNAAIIGLLGVSRW